MCWIYSIILLHHEFIKTPICSIFKSGCHEKTGRNFEGFPGYLIFQVKNFECPVCIENNNSFYFIRQGLHGNRS